MSPISPDERAQREQRLRALARLMDTAFEIPGTNFRVGIDPILGLAPGLGDALAAVISLYIVAEGAKLGASRWTVARMLANVILDTVGGSVPLVGDIFDAAFKANIRNLRLLGIPLEEPPPRRSVTNEAQVEDRRGASEPLRS